MATKIYSIKANQAQLYFRIGSVKVKAMFKGGNLDKDMNRRYATLTTDNPLVQEAIENDGRFGTVIKLERTFGEDEVKKRKPANPHREQAQETAPANVSSIPDGFTVVQSITTINDAREYLIKEKGVPYQGLVGKDKIYEAAQRVKVHFPNVDFNMK